MKNKLRTAMRAALWLYIALFVIMILYVMSAFDIEPYEIIDLFWGVVLFFAVFPQCLAGLAALVVLIIMNAVIWHRERRDGEYTVSRAAAGIFLTLAAAGLIVSACGIVPAYADYYNDKARRAAERSAKEASMTATEKEALQFLEDSENEKFIAVQEYGRSVVCAPADRPEIVFFVSKTNGEISYEENYRRAVIERTLQKRQQELLDGLAGEWYCFPEISIYEPWEYEGSYGGDFRLDDVKTESVRYWVFGEFREDFDRQAAFEKLHEMCGLLDSEYAHVEFYFVNAEDTEDYREFYRTTPFVVIHHTTSSYHVEMDADTSFTEFSDKLDEIIPKRREELEKKR